jgi:hypothetical protein
LERDSSPQILTHVPVCSLLDAQKVQQTRICRKSVHRPTSVHAETKQGTRSRGDVGWDPYQEHWWRGRSRRFVPPRRGAANRWSLGTPSPSEHPRIHPALELGSAWSAPRARPGTTAGALLWGRKPGCISPGQVEVAEARGPSRVPCRRPSIFTTCPLIRVAITYSPLVWIAIHNRDPIIYI